MNNNNNVDTELNDKTALEAVIYLQRYIENEQRIKDSYSTLDKNYNKLNENYNSLLTDYNKLKERCVELERINSNYQSALGNVTNFRLNDNDKNNSVQLTEDILRLQDDLEIYVTNLRPNIEINYKNVKNLLSKYKSKTRLSSTSSDIPIIKATIQRHVLETIFGYFSVYANTKNFNEPYSLEALIANKAEELIILTQEFGKTREGNDSITLAVPTKMRQQIYSALGNRGFSNIMIEQGTYEHFFVSKFKTKLNEEMEQYRKILNPIKKKEIEEKAANIILDVIRIFFFRIQTQEPIGQFYWFQNKDKIDPGLMNGMWDDDKFDDFEVDICKFPLVGIELNDDIKRKIYTHAIILPQKVQRTKSESKHVKQESKHKADNQSNSESNFNVNSQYQPQSDVKAPSKSEFKAENLNRIPQTTPQTPQSQTSPQTTLQTPQPQTSSLTTPQTPQPQTSSLTTPQTPQYQTSSLTTPQTPQSQTSPQTTPQTQNSPQTTPQTPQSQTSPQTIPQTPQPQTSPQTTPQTPQSQTSSQTIPQTPQPQTSPQTTLQPPQTSQSQPQSSPQTTSQSHSGSEVDPQAEGKKKNKIFGIF
ncbi:18344_t:CDS:2 [Rhizophagus irregularis]|nr:18344_t:CDS:2 [Rhizophagus irregularis]